MKRILAIGMGLSLLSGLAVVMSPLGHRALLLLRGSKTVEQRVADFGPEARERWSPDFARAGVTYPPSGVVLVGVKSERHLLVYADGRLVRRIAVLGQSGDLGLKSREGDRQVPEGLYAVDSLNPNSRFHLALRVSYPNADDLARAAAEGRTPDTLGGDIMIHGGSLSIGCLAVGDEAAEDLFVLAADAGIENVTVLLTPVDFRHADHLPADERTAGVYEQLRAALNAMPPNGGAGGRMRD